MKKKPSHPARRLPIDFGDEPVFLIPIKKRVRDLRTGKVGRAYSRAGSLAPIGEEGRDLSRRSPAKADEGGLKKSILFGSKFKIQHSKLPERGFTLVEILVVLALLSLIVFALMAVFSATQRAFRASLTQTDTLEGGRAVMNLISGDLEAMFPSGGPNDTAVVNGPNGPSFNSGNSPINFSCNVKTFPSPPSYPSSPFRQSLIGSPSGALRTNLLEDIFILSKGNINGVSSWIGTGYSVNTNLADGTLYPLYRFYMATNASTGIAGQTNLFFVFSQFQYTNSARWSHLMDGVVNLTARTYNTNGIWLTNGFYAFNAVPFFRVQNATFIGSGLGETSCFFVSNAVPASVNVVLGTLEDRVLQHAEALSGFNQSNYLGNAAGQVHLFSRRVWIRNLDPTAYQ